MMKLVLVMMILGATIFENVAEAQRRGHGPTRGDRDRWNRVHYPAPPPPPVVVISPRPRATNMALIRDAQDGLILGCRVLGRVDGWANQLYVHGVFSGNFRDGYEDVRLAQVLDDYLASGRCRYDDYHRIHLRNRLNQNPYLIEDFIRGASRNCYVLPSVSGWAHQIYINGVFSGNYHHVSELHRLRQDLVAYVVNGVCQYAH